MIVCNEFIRDFLDIQDFDLIDKVLIQKLKLVCSMSSGIGNSILEVFRQ